jgi:hypothetical protein
VPAALVEELRPRAGRNAFNTNATSSQWRTRALYTTAALRNRMREEVTMRADYELLPDDDFEDDDGEDEEQDEDEEGEEDEEEGTWYVSTKLSTSLDFSSAKSL